MARVDLSIVQQEEFTHEQELPAVPGAAERAAEIGGRWRIGSPRQHPTAWASWADWTDSSDADDGERTQTAGLETGGNEEDGDHELLTNIEDKLRRAQAAKAESRPWGAQLDSALANLEKAKLQIERAQEKVDRAQDDLHAAKTHEAEAENGVQKLRELVAQDPEMTQEANRPERTLTQ